MNFMICHSRLYLFIQVYNQYKLKFSLSMWCLIPFSYLVDHYLRRRVFFLTGLTSSVTTDFYPFESPLYPISKISNQYLISVLELSSDIICITTKNGLRFSRCTWLWNIEKLACCFVIWVRHGIVKMTYVPYELQFKEE
jgi:hypothetical protein